MSTSQTCNALLLTFLHTLLAGCSSDLLFYVQPTIIDKYMDGERYTIGLSVNSTDLVVLLTKNRDVSSTYKVYTQDEYGNLIARRKAPSCQYHGSVVGHPHSNVVLSNCDGLSGRIQLGRTEYRIESVKEASSGSYHRHGHIDYGTYPQEYIPVLEDKMTGLHSIKLPPVYKEEYTVAHIPLDEFQDMDLKEQDKSRAKRLTSYRYSQKEIQRANVRKLERRYLEISVIIDSQMYKTLGRNEQKATDWAEKVVNHIASKYKPYNFIPCMVQLIIWKSYDLVKLPSPYRKLMETIGEYRRDVLLGMRWSDVTILISGHPFSDNTSVIGGAFTNTMCDDLRSTNVNSAAHLFEDEPYLATLIAHEIGHVLGMYHDDDAENSTPNKYGSCECPCRAEDFDNIRNYRVPDFCGDDDRCIMFSIINKNYDYFSLCSRRLLEERISRHRCLFNAPMELHSSSVPTCGNAIIEEGETCDCGSPEDCPILDPCCEVGTCQLRNTSSCFTGACCSDQCQFEKRGTLCREKVPGMECDFEETCTGLESACPRDTYKQDGRQCKDSGNAEGFCSSSDCNTKLSQCRMLYGDRAQVGSDSCWEHNVKKQSWLGECGNKDDSYKGCKEKDIKCRLLHCQVHKNYLEAARENVYNFRGRDRVSFGSYDTPGRNNYLCMVSKFIPPNTDADESEVFTDYGQVLDYTKCDTDRFCYEKECKYIEPPKCPSYNGSECGGHGTCNNLNQCHCDNDWSNDMCVDLHISPDTVDYKAIIALLCIAVIIVPVVVGVLVYVIKHKFNLKKMAEDRQTITRGIRRLSTRVSIRVRSSTRSDESRRDTNKAATVTTQYSRKDNEPLPSLTNDKVFHNPTHEIESEGKKNSIEPAPTGRVQMKSFLSGIRIPKIGDSKREVPLPKRDVSSKPESKAVVPVRVPPKFPVKLEDQIKKPILPVKPSPTNSRNGSRNTSPSSRVPKIGDSKRKVPFPTRDVSSKLESKAVVPVRVPSKLPVKLEDQIKKPILPVKPSPTNSRNGSRNTSPYSSTSKLNGSTGGGPPGVKPPPPPPPSAKKLAPHFLRNSKDGLKLDRPVDRPNSERFKNVKIPFNNLQTSEKTTSDNSLTKKPVQPPKLLAGKNNESKKLQISGPGTNGGLVGLDGRPKFLLSATDIKRSSDSINSVSSTKALFEQNKKPTSKWK